MKTLVISLGGSLIIPDKINYNFLHKFKSTLRKFYRTHKFVVVCGGGEIARKYISNLSKEHKSKYKISQAGIRATRMNANFMIQFFGKDANSKLPRDMKEVKEELEKNSVVFCGALRYVPNSTSDSTAARLAHFLKTPFINMTNVKGLYSANPLTNKRAKFIQYESWKDFEKRALKLSYHAGQHFVLDQKASIIIRKHKIKTYIIGSKLINLENIIREKKFTGTIISN
jgi:uridylate kinase